VKKQSAPHSAGAMADVKIWEPSDEEEITPALLHHILGVYHEGNPDTEQMRRVLLWFADLVGTLDHPVTYRTVGNPQIIDGIEVHPIENVPVPEALFEYLREAIYRMLAPKRSKSATGKKAKKRPISADQALGLIAPAKRPKRPEAEDFKIAHAMLVRLLNGKTARHSAIEMQVEFDLGYREIEEIASRSLMLAIYGERARRELNHEDFTTGERGTLAKLIKARQSRETKRATISALQKVLNEEFTETERNALLRTIRGKRPRHKRVAVKALRKK
jgi:hypothetical protein